MYYCRCCGAEMGNSDHCPECGCEEFEETCEGGVKFNRTNGEYIGARKK